MVENSSPEKVRRHEKDTGTPEAQIAYLTDHIGHLTNHLRKHQHDYSTRRSLLKLVGRRTRLMRYLKRRDDEKHQLVCQTLGLRK